MNKFKCSMSKKKESLTKKSEATTEDISVKLTELKDVTDADKVLDDLKKLGFYTIEYGDYASKDTSYAVLKHPNGMYAELDYTWVQDSSGRDSYSPGEVVAYDYFKDKDEYEEIHGYSPNESKNSEANLDDLKGMVVSEGTMRSEDLIPKFLNVLKTYAVDTYDDYVKENPEVLDLKGMDDETMGYVFDELFDKLDEIAPEGFYFAAHPDDGACYGFWEVAPDESKKPEDCKGGKKVEKTTSIGDTMYASKLKSLVRKFANFGVKVADNVDVLEENANDKSADYKLTASKDSNTYSIKVSIYEGNHTDISVTDGNGKSVVSGGGKSFASALSTIEASDFDGTNESKKSEGIGDYIKMNIDYNTFMRLLDAAAYLEADDDYKDALWEYFSEFGELDGDACEFFDNLFQYTDWYTAEEVWENYDNILGTKPEDKDAEEALDAYLEEHGDDLGGASVYKHGDHYLILQ